MKKLEFYFSVPEDMKPATTNIARIAHNWLPNGWTLHHVHGGWQGQTERAYILTTLVEHNHPDYYAKDFAMRLGQEFAQKEVLFTSVYVDGEVIKCE